jgi:YidC/Oxa1 family membrane protein insertase
MGLKIASYDGNDINKVDFRKVKTKPTKNPDIQTAEGGIQGFSHWVAFETTYFAAIFKTSDQNAGIRYYVRKEKIQNEKNVQWKVNSYMVVNNPTHVYLGPKDESILSTVEDVFYDVNKVVEYGFFGPIAKIMLKGIMLSYKVIPNYGWAIILFTLILKILLFPLTYASSVSMAKMQALQPKIKAIKKKYKNQKDPEQRRQMNIETMALYKQEKVNPAGGCLPMLLQLPILFGIFMLLKVSINIRHEPWIMWIKDLSVKDPIYLIPILMGITQILLQKMSPSTGDSSQKKMMYLMPVVITFFVASLPSGLTLYWFVSNLLQMGQQHFINKKIFQQKKDEEKARKSLKRKKGAKVR